MGKYKKGCGCTIVHWGLGTAIILFFQENVRGSREDRCKKLFSATFVKNVFQYFERFLANLALKLQKVLS
jgi:hypothetical protein